MTTWQICTVALVKDELELVVGCLYHLVIKDYKQSIPSSPSPAATDNV